MVTVNNPKGKCIIVKKRTTIGAKRELTKMMNECEFTSDEDDSDNDIDYSDDDNEMDSEDDNVYNRDDDDAAMSTPISVKDEIPIKLKDVESGMWVIVLHEGEKFFGKVHHKEGKIYILFRKAIWN